MSKKIEAEMDTEKALVFLQCVQEPPPSKRMRAEALAAITGWSFERTEAALDMVYRVEKHYGREDDLPD